MNNRFFNIMYCLNLELENILTYIYEKFGD